MLYLLLQQSRDRDYYKAGYASNINKRMPQYESHCPFTEKLLERPGELYEENILHKYLHMLPDVEFIKDEWYSVKPGDTRIKDLFMNSFDDMKKDLWIHRKDNGLFKNSELDMSLYDELCTMYGEITSEDVQYIPDLIKQTQLEILELNDFFVNNKEFSKRMCFYCWFRDQHPELTVEIIGAITVPVRYHEYYEKYGTSKMRSVSYREAEFKNFPDPVMFSSRNIVDLIKQFFIPGQNYSNKEVKSKLQEIYDTAGYNKTAKATDILEYFKTRSAGIVTDKGRIKGIKILSIK